MTRDEAKLILQSYRPGGQDAGDPHFADALALAKTDVKLAAWFAAEQKFDAGISNSLQQVRVPSRLKAEILAFKKAETPPISTWWRNLFTWQSPVAWAMATAVVVLLSFTVFWKKPANAASFADYSAQMVKAATQDATHVDVHAADLKQAEAWLTAHRGESNLVLPVALNEDKGLMGCRVLDWRGQKVSMLCYIVNGSEHVDVFVANANIFPDAPPANRPQFARSRGKATVSWTHDGNSYLAVSHGDAAILKKLMSPGSVVKLFPGRFISLPDHSGFQKFVWNKSPDGVSNL